MSEFEAAKEVITRLESKGFQAYFAGGCVRDKVLGHIPKDYDVATSATPEIVEQLFPKTLPIGKAFGVIQVQGDQHTTEVATFRSDGEYKDGRRPETVVYSSSAKEDVSRRDFTINGMLMHADGKVEDHVGGMKDIRDRLIRAIGDPEKRFKEDGLRMMRAIRFACQLGFEIEESTFEAIRNNAMNLGVISKERKRDELAKILTSGRADLGVFLLNRAGLLSRVLNNHKVVAMEELEKLAYLPKDCTLFLALKVLGMSGWQTKEWLKCSNVIDKGIEQLSSNPITKSKFVMWDMSRKVKFLRNPIHEFSLQEYEIECKTNRCIKDYNDLLTEIADVPVEKITQKRIITGDDLKSIVTDVNTLEMMLEAAEEAQLNDKFTNKESGIAWVQKKFPGAFNSSEARYLRTCMSCGNIMSFRAGVDLFGEIKTPIANTAVGCVWHYGAYMHCRGGTYQNCGRRAMRRTFVREAQ